MAFTVGANGGQLSGPSQVIVAPAPTGSNKRIAKSLIIYNNDTAAVTANVCIWDGATLIQLYTATIQPTFTFASAKEDIFVLDTTSKYLVVFLSAPPATNQPTFYVSWGDLS